jgi:sugar transferase (PEP-CTERM/EpsH1 system associated)
MDGRIHIAHVVLSLQPGGLENGVVNVINGLDRSRFRSSVVCLKVAGEFAPRIQAPGTTVHAMGLRPGLDWRMPWRVARLLRRERVHLVHTRNAESFFYGGVAAKIGGISHLVHSEHGRTFDDHPRRFWAQRQLTRFTDRVFSVSGQLRTDLCRHVGLQERQVEVLYNGVDLLRFGSVDRDQARRALGYAPTDVVVGSVGRLVTVKNFPLLLDALADPALAHVHAFIVGDGPLRAELQARIDAHGMGGRVRLLGHRDDVPALLPAMDVFVLPSTHEGMSNTLLEAMACGVAPVASRVGGNAEVLGHDGNGLLFESGDEAGLRQALARVCNDAGLRARMGHAARQRALDAFDIRAMIRNYETMYESIASNSERRR